MPGGVEGDSLLQPGHPAQAMELLVDIRIVLQAEEVRLSRPAYLSKSSKAFPPNSR